MLPCVVPGLGLHRPTPSHPGKAVALLKGLPGTLSWAQAAQYLDGAVCQG